ncbi:unnamed protein product [Gemmataceae bacterium]|nr:unnamed protein product [Gemmataceae bacterium]VTT99537.1 unnamed protein product [Gemmataceae bacterium]
MNQPPKHREDDSVRERAEAERFAALLTLAAYGMALRHGVVGSFADLELDLWRVLQVVVSGNIAGACRPHCVARRT